MNVPRRWITIEAITAVAADWGARLYVLPIFVGKRWGIVILRWREMEDK